MPAAFGIMRCFGFLALTIACSAAVGQQTCDAGRTPPTPSRFADNGDGTVTDTRSGLMWTRCSSGQPWLATQCVGQASKLSWQSAQEVASELNRRGELFYNDWRVPQIHELAMIADLRCAHPRIDLVLFPGTSADLYWSASVRPAAGAQAFALSFGPEGVRRENKAELAHVRLVRSAQ